MRRLHFLTISYEERQASQRLQPVPTALLIENHIITAISYQLSCRVFAGMNLPITDFSV